MAVARRVLDLFEAWIGGARAHDPAKAFIVREAVDFVRKELGEHPEQLEDASEDPFR